MTLFNNQAKDSQLHLAEIHAAPSWLWDVLITATSDKGWSVEQTRAAVKRVKGAVEPPEWADHDCFADAIVSGEEKPTIAILLAQDVATAHKRIEAKSLHAAAQTPEIAKLIESAGSFISVLGFHTLLDKMLLDMCPVNRSEVARIINSVLTEQDELIKEYREKATKSQLAKEAARRQRSRK